MSYTFEELLKIEPDVLQVLFLNKEITALQLIEAQPSEKGFYDSFLRATKTTKCEQTAEAYLEYDCRMAGH